MNNLLLIYGLLALPLVASAEDFQITMERKKTFIPEKGGKGEKGIERSAHRWIGEIKIENKMRTASPEMVAKYIVFVTRQNIGQKARAESFEQVKGSAPVPPLHKQGAASFSTEEVELHQAHVSQGFYLTKGGQAMSNDSIAGIWVKLYRDGKEVAEYANPVSLKARLKFE